MALQNEMNNLFPEETSFTKESKFPVFNDTEDLKPIEEIVEEHILDLAMGVELDRQGLDILNNRKPEKRRLQDGGDVGTSPYVPPVYVPPDGDPAGSGGIDTGTNTVAGTIAALGVAAIGLSNANLTVMAGKLGKSLVTGQPATPNVAPLSMQIAAMEDYTETEQGLVDVEAAEAEYGKGTSSEFAGAPASGSGTTGAVGGTVGGSAVGEQSDDTGPAGTPQGLSQDDPSETGLGYSGHGSGGAMSDTGNISAAADAASIGVSAGPSAGSGDDAGTDAGSGTGVGGGDAWKHGGQIKGYQEGDLVVPEQADTELDIEGLGPMGLVDDIDGEQVTGVADDLEMQLPEGSYVLNAHTVELVGVRDLNEMVKEAISIAIESDLPLPKEVDATDKVPIKISNGEFVIPAVLVPILGVENLEKMNKRGLEYRDSQKIKEEEGEPVATAPETNESLAEEILPTV